MMKGFIQINFLPPLSLPLSLFAEHRWLDTHELDACRDACILNQLPFSPQGFQRRRRAGISQLCRGGPVGPLLLPTLLKPLPQPHKQIYSSET